MKTQNVLMAWQQCWVLLQQWVLMLSVARLFQVSGDMLVLSLSLFCIFILMAIFKDTDIDDDDGPGGGTLVPAHDSI